MKSNIRLDPATEHGTRRNRIASEQISPTPSKQPVTGASGQGFPWSRVSGLTRKEAEELIQWLRSRDNESASVFYVPDEGFTVSYCAKPGRSFKA